ncbi:type II toxin-antitoxin system RelE/ParE family toxin [Methylobacter sp. Wu1]|uniref:type II toxin-antitoxin system RelE/ParE family toxin n=1 Tax=Methylobacter sp. Wu1 TaxID=3119359 RepID=UPI002F94FEA6
MTVVSSVVTILCMIKTFANKETAAAFQGLPVKRFPSDIRVRIRSKLQQLHAVALLDDLRVPPGNRLESLKGDRIGQYSIRVNDQWRICFIWRDGNAYDVEIIDYH